MCVGLLAASAAAGDGTCTVAVHGQAACTCAAAFPAVESLPQDATFSRRNSRIDMVSAQLTYVQPVGASYVGYVAVKWGNLSNISISHAPLAEWDGHVSVSQGHAKLATTYAFELLDPTDSWQNTKVYRQAVKAFANERKVFVHKLDVNRTIARQEAIRAIRSARKLRRKLKKIDQVYADELAQFDEIMDARLAQVRNEIIEQASRGADRIVADGGRKVAWQATVAGGYDGVLVRLVLPQPCVAGVIQAGEHTIHFQTELVPQYRRAVVVASNNATTYASSPYDAYRQAYEDAYAREWLDHFPSVKLPPIGSLHRRRQGHSKSKRVVVTHHNTPSRTSTSHGHSRRNARRRNDDQSICAPKPVTAKRHRPPHITPTRHDVPRVRVGLRLSHARIDYDSRRGVRVVVRR
jgi:hypothetical protein